MEVYKKRLNEWKSSFTAPGERTPQGELGRQMEEGVELYLAVSNYDGSKKAKDEVIEESIDNIICLLGVVNSIDPSVNVDNVMTKKLSVIDKKYDPKKINGYKKKGMTTNQALIKCKEEYAA